jgi:hypothetical protein
MKSYALLLLCTLCASAILRAQSPEAMKKIESARIALISERLGLTPDQAEKFWPLYREYADQRRAIRQQLQQERGAIEPGNLSDAESRALMERALELKQRELNLEKTYSERLMQVISSQQMLQLRNAERDFQEMLLRRLQMERERQLERQRMMQRRENLKDRMNN